MEGKEGVDESRDQPLRKFRGREWSGFIRYAKKKDRISSIILQKAPILRQNKYYYSLIPPRYHENISL